MKFPVTLAVKDCTNMVPQKVLTKRKLLAQYLLLYPIYTVIAQAALCGLLAVAFGWSFSYAKSFFLVSSIFLVILFYVIPNSDNKCTTHG